MLDRFRRIALRGDSLPLRQHQPQQARLFFVIEYHPTAENQIGSFVRGMRLESVDPMMEEVRGAELLTRRLTLRECSAPLGAHIRVRHKQTLEVKEGSFAPLCDCDLGCGQSVSKLRLNAPHLNHEPHHARRVTAGLAALDEVRQRVRAREGDPRIVLLAKPVGRIAHLPRK
jgi:hypothetical protein